MDRKIIKFVFLFVLTLNSCLGIVDESNNEPLKQIDPKSLSGDWQADQFSYEYTSDFIKNKKSQLLDSMKIELNENGSCRFTNCPLIQDDLIIQKTISGNWTIDTLDNSDLELNLKGYNSQYQILPSNNSKLFINRNSKEYRLYFFIDDPESGDRLGFYKKIQVDKI